MGIEENIVTLCFECHRKYDQTEERGEIRETLRRYLMSIYPDWENTRLTYSKYLD